MITKIKIVLRHVRRCLFGRAFESGDKAVLVGRTYNAYYEQDLGTEVTFLGYRGDWDCLVFSKIRGYVQVCHESDLKRL